VYAVYANFKNKNLKYAFAPMIISETSKSIVNVNNNFLSND